MATKIDVERTGARAAHPGADPARRRRPGRRGRGRLAQHAETRAGARRRADGALQARGQQGRAARRHGRRRRRRDRPAPRGTPTGRRRSASGSCRPAGRCCATRGPRRSSSRGPNPTPTVLGYMDSMIGMFRAGGFSVDLTHHAMHAMGSRLLGFSQELFDDRADDRPAVEATMLGAWPRPTRTSSRSSRRPPTTTRRSSGPAATTSSSSSSRSTCSSTGSSGSADRRGRAAQPPDRSYQRRTRSARSVFHRLGRPSPSSSTKWTLPGWVFSSSHVPSGCCLDRSNSHRLVHPRVRRIAGRSEVLQGAQHVVVPAGRKRELQPGRVDDLARALAPEQPSFEEVLFAPASRRDGFRRAAGGLLVRQQPFQDVDRGVERRANGAVLRLAVPPAVLELLVHEAGDDALDVLAEVGAEGDGPAVDARLDLPVEERLAGVLPAAVVSDLRHGPSHPLVARVDPEVPQQR